MADHKEEKKNPKLKTKKAPCRAASCHLHIEFTVDQSVADTSSVNALGFYFFNFIAEEGLQ